MVNLSRRDKGKHPESKYIRLIVCLLDGIEKESGSRSTHEVGDDLIAWVSFSHSSETIGEPVPIYFLDCVVNK